MTIRLEPGDMREVLARLKAEGVVVQSVVCDPPYHLTSIVKRFGADNAAPAKAKQTGAYARASRGFMGKQWDGGDIAFDPATWRLAYDLLPPGGHLLAFSGTRTYHRMACAIEDAGFEIRDTIAWLYGSGFPKSHSVEKSLDPRSEEEIAAGVEQCVESLAWCGWGTALKPAIEPICLARKPLEGTVAASVLKHGTGALNIDGCRVATREDLNGGTYSGERRAREGVDIPDAEPGAIPLSRLRNGAGEFRQPAARWPANVVHDGSADVVEAFPRAPGQQRAAIDTERKTRNVFGPFAGNATSEPRGDEGSAARFFYSSKADAGDRLGSKHPTVKPVDLMRWLVRLVTPPGGTVLDPFAGSGTTGMACVAEGFDCILVEREAEYVADIRRRIAHVSGEDTALFAHGRTAAE